MRKNEKRRILNFALPGNDFVTLWQKFREISLYSVFEVVLRKQLFANDAKVRVVLDFSSHFLKNYVKSTTVLIFRKFSVLQILCEIKLSEHSTSTIEYGI